MFSPFWKMKSFLDLVSWKIEQCWCAPIWNQNPILKLWFCNILATCVLIYFHSSISSASFKTSMCLPTCGVFPFFIWLRTLPTLEACAWCWEYIPLAFMTFLTVCDAGVLKPCSCLLVFLLNVDILCSGLIVDVPGDFGPVGMIDSTAFFVSYILYVCCIPLRALCSL